MSTRITRTFAAIATAGALSVGGAVGAMASPACEPTAATAYVVNQFSNTVTPINTATNAALKPIGVGQSRTPSQSLRTAEPPTLEIRAPAR